MVTDISDFRNNVQHALAFLLSNTKAAKDISHSNNG